MWGEGCRRGGGQPLLAMRRQTWYAHRPILPRTKQMKMTPDEVRRLHVLRQNGWTQTKLCVEFKISINQVARILNGSHWQGIWEEFNNPAAVRARKELEEMDDAALMAKLDSEMDFKALIKLSEDVVAGRVETIPLDQVFSIPKTELPEDPHMTSEIRARLERYGFKKP